MRNPCGIRTQGLRIATSAPRPSSHARVKDEKYAHAGSV